MPCSRLSITAIRQSAPLWRLGSTQPPIARRRPPVGTTLSFVLGEAARATLSFAHQAPGRSPHDTCAAPSVKKTRPSRCARTIAAGTLTLDGHDGLNLVRFQGRIARNKTLHPGRHAMTIIGTTTAGQRTHSRSLHFTVAR